jgi:hypothetical protein
MTRTYTEEEVASIRIEERFVAYLVLSSANIKLAQQPVQYREARNRVAEIVRESQKYDDLTKERFASYLVMVDNCTPFNERPEKLNDAYTLVMKDILAPPKKDED